MRNLKYKIMDKEKLNSVSAKEIVNIGGQIFYNNCSNKKFKEKIMDIGLKDPKFAIELFNVVQKAYSQGMQHGAAMVAYGTDPEVKKKILKVTEYDEKMFEFYWEMSKEYLKVV
jgi:hypothetical protein